MNELQYTLERKVRHKCINMSVRDREGVAEREGWSSESSDRRTKRSVKRVKRMAREGVGGDNGGRVHVTVSIALTVFVGFGAEVQVGGSGEMVIGESSA